MGLIFKDKDDKTVGPKTMRNRTILLSLPFAIVAVLALIFILHDEIASGFHMERQKATGLLSVAVFCVGLIVLIFAISSKKQALTVNLAKTDDEKPWLKRKDWAKGRITSSLHKAVMLLWIFVAFWCVASAVICLVVVPEQLRQRNHAALIALVFPVIGLAIIFFALNTTRVWRKFNRTIFAMAAVPVAPGGTLAGEIQVKAGLQPRHGWHLRLSCIRRTTSGAGIRRATSEKLLWQDEKWLRADLPQAGSNATVIPVFFKLPGNLPESSVSPDDGIHWKLEASAELRGPNFHAAFDLPVFKTSEIPAVPDDPTVQHQISLDEIRKQIRSPIQVNALPDGGKEFVFPAARNPGFASGATTVCLVWTGIIAVLLWKHAPPPFLLVFSAIDLLMAVFVADLWFRRSRVVVNQKGVTVQRAWLAFQKQQRFPTGEIKNIAFDVGATAGHAAYHDLKVQARDGKEFILAKNLNSQPEADWLVRQMIAALKSPVQTT